MWKSPKKRSLLHFGGNIWKKHSKFRKIAREIYSKFGIVTGKSRKTIKLKIPGPEKLGKSFLIHEPLIYWATHLNFVLCLKHIFGPRQQIFKIFTFCLWIFASFSIHMMVAASACNFAIFLECCHEYEWMLSKTYSPTIASSFCKSSATQKYHRFHINQRNIQIKAWLFE